MGEIGRRGKGGGGGGRREVGGGSTNGRERVDGNGVEGLG